jgi:hypothetical protein
MFVVPLPGDEVTTDGGAKFKVTEYTNYKELGPAVYVERSATSKSDPVYFKDIVAINDVKVEYVAGGKVLQSLGRIKRRYHLPQPDDTITAKLDGEPVNLEVTGYKLHRRGELSKGLLFVCQEEEDGDKIYVRLTQVIDVRRALGNDMFNRDRFLSYYDDYTGTGA